MAQVGSLGEIEAPKLQVPSEVAGDGVGVANPAFPSSSTIHHLPRPNKGFSLNPNRSLSRGRSRSQKGQDARGKGSLLHLDPPPPKSKAVNVSPAPAPDPKLQNRRPTLVPVRSWAAVARSTIKGYAFSYIPPAVVKDRVVVDISNDILAASNPKWEECIVGYFIGKKLPFRLIETTLKHVWGAYLEDILPNDEGFYFFHIPDKDYRRKILDNGCFMVAKVPLVLQQFHPLMDLQKARHQAIPIWVHLRHIPFSLWSTLGISAVASAIGKPLYVDEQTEVMKRISFALVCIEVQGGSPLPDKIEVRIEGECRSILVEYEWRPSYCPTCATFGHRCPATNPMNSATPPVKAEEQSALVQVIPESTPQPPVVDTEAWQVVGNRRSSKPSASRSVPSPSLV